MMAAHRMGTMAGPFVSRDEVAPSEVQSEMGHPWSRVLNGHAPLLMWRYHLLRGPGTSCVACDLTLPAGISV